MNDEHLCNICYSRKFDKECHECKFKSCNKCLHDLFIKYANEQPKCPNCNVLFTIEEIYEALGRVSFLQEYIPKAILLTFNKEMQKIPLCMECCEKIKENEKIKLFINSIKPGISKLSKIYCILKEIPTVSDDIDSAERDMVVNLIIELITNLINYYSNMDDSELSKCTLTSLITIVQNCLPHINLKNNEKNKLMDLLSNMLVKRTNYSLDIIIKAYSARILHPSYIINEAWQKISNKRLGLSTKNKYLFKCPKNDCRGYITTDYECHICSSKFCPKCLVEIPKNDFSHKCKEEDIESLKEILDSTKPCPKCSTRIYKISGCSQMFCTNCHTAFDWNTGNIITGHFHNPHYTEWVRRQGGVECEEFNVKFLSNSNLLYRISQRNHIDAMINKLNRDIRDIVSGQTYFELLCKYVIGELDKYSLYKSISKHELLKIKNTMLINIYTYFVGAVSDILMNAKGSETVDMNKLKQIGCNTKLLTFVEVNKMLPFVKQFSNLSESEFKKTFETICDMSEIIVPNDCDKHALISLLAKNRELVSEFHSYDTEEEIINKITDRCNFLLYRYAYMFKLRKYSVIADANITPYVYQKNIKE